MKKRIITIIAILGLFILVCAVIFDFNSKNSKLTKIKVAEVAHSIFYAPQYAAISEGYFEDEGLDIDLTLTPGADKVTDAVLSDHVKIGI